jgi:spermidine synthase
MNQNNQSVAPVATPRWPGVVFAGTILLSAFLLFQVQPLISKVILPWFGGCPAVWTTCMLFFQIILFAGYTYAHLAGSRLTLRGQAIAQMLILLAAVCLLPIIPGTSWKPTGSEAPTWRILLLLSATVGLPYFVLSTTSPLIQVWFSRSYPGRSPYRLYALSNFGSLAALLSYPFVFEPAFDLTRQSWLWSVAFAVYVLLCGASAAWLWKISRSLDDVGQVGNLPSVTSDPGRLATCPTDAGRLVTYPTVALWVFLPACASLMLLATTNHVCQNVAVVPFLWVVPLSLYLLSFIICFDHSRWYVRGFWVTLAIFAILAAVGLHDILPLVNKAIVRLKIRPTSDLSLNYVQDLTLYFSTMFIICMVCHGELVKLRPHPRHLTGYYLCISAGGALGGIFVSLLAPMIFPAFFEWHLGLALSFIVAVAALAVIVRKFGLFAVSTTITIIAGLGLFVIFQASKAGSTVVKRERNFYGVISVSERDVGDSKHRFVLLHGTIRHGEQYIAPDDPQKRRIALTYYGKTSGVGRVLEHLQSDRPVMRVGVIGLGVGTMASYARDKDNYRFYEINPAVRQLSDEGGFYTYLSDARKRGATVEAVMGDARLSLEREVPQKFDLLVLDAFSGDSIPVHLLTREAFQIYRRHMAAGGVIAVHISNSYLNLAPVVRGLAQNGGLSVTGISTPDDDALDLLSNDWMLVSEDAKLIAAFPTSASLQAKADQAIPLWTDHYNNLFKIMK